MHLKAVASSMLAVFAGLISTDAIAAQIYCTAPVEWVGVNPAGNMAVRLTGIGTATLCNVSSSYGTVRGTVGADTCKSWYAGFQTAKARGASTTLIFDFGESAAQACDTYGWNWQNPSIYPIIILF